MNTLETIEVHDLKDLLKRCLPELEAAATAEARANRAPTGLKPRTAKLDLLRDVKSALQLK